MAKKLNLKPLLIEKGERIGLAVAAVLSFLLLTMGVLKGFSSGSAAANGEQLEQYVKKMEDAQRSARPGPNDEPPDSKGKPPEKILNLVANASDYTARPYFYGPKVKDMMRQKPTIFQPDETLVAVVHGQLESLDFIYKFEGEQQVPDRVTMLKSEKAEGNNVSQGIRGLPSAAGRGGNMGRPGAMGAMGALGGAGGRFPGTSSGLYGRRTATKAEKGLEVKVVPIEEAESAQKGLILATKVLPMRMAIIAASFPYKKQVEEFRDKLRLDTHGAVLTERVKGEKDESWNSFQFRGVIVERAEVPEPGKEFEWAPLQVAEDYKKLLIETNKKYEKDPKDLAPIKEVSRGLVMELPRQFKEGQYPDLVGKLTNIKATLDKLKDEEKKKNIVVPKHTITDQNFNPFDLDNDKGGKTSDGGGDKGPPRGNPYVIAGTGREREIKETPIDHCLLRFIDTKELEPGKAYRYHLKVRMANPNYSPTPNERKDTYPQFANDKELESDWFLVPQTVVVPPESAVYAVDQRSVEPRLGGRPGVERDEAVVQLQRWVQEYAPDPRKQSEKHAVGEWVVAARVVVRRGEYVRERHYKTAIPIKPLNLLNFDLDEKSTLSFGDETILVDFEGGPVRYERVEGEGEKQRKVILSDQAATELLCLTPDGRLYTRVNTLDEVNPDRKRVYRTYLDRKDEIRKRKEGGGNTNPIGGGGNPIK